MPVLSTTHNVCVGSTPTMFQPTLFCNGNYTQCVCLGSPLPMFQLACSTLATTHNVCVGSTPTHCFSLPCFTMEIVANVEQASRNIGGGEPRHTHQHNVTAYPVLQWKLHPMCVSGLPTANISASLFYIGNYTQCVCGFHTNTLFQPTLFYNGNYTQCVCARTPHHQCFS